MTELLRRIAAIAIAEVHLRFRKTTAVVTLLIIAAGVYLIVPEVETGQTLIQIEGSRVLYNSAAVALGTGMFCTIFISMLGFYLVSNSLRRDTLCRVGSIVAASPVTNAEYLIGKFVGTGVYLAGLTLACMMSAMVMFLLRGEGALEPMVFLSIYAWLALPTVAFAASAAVAFESLTPLSGRVGDVVYFFFWAALLGVPASLFAQNPSSSLITSLDIVGIIPVIAQIQEQFHTTSFSIGSAPFDATRPAILFPGLAWSWKMIAFRSLGFALPVILLLAARLWFHRFDPQRIRSSVRHARTSMLTRVNTLLKPLTRAFLPLMAVSEKRRGDVSFLTIVRADVATTFALYPGLIVAFIVNVVLSLALDLDAMRTGLLPVIVVLLTIALAEISVRDHSSRMISVLFTLPGLQPNFVLWKVASGILITFCFTLVPVIRLALTMPSTAASLAIGSCFMAATAVSFGILTRSPKPYAAFTLMLLYISLNAVTEPSLDFAGFNGVATPSVQVAYALATAIFLSIAYFKFRSTTRNM